MAISELRGAALSLALAALSCYASRPHGSAESALSVAALERACHEGSPAACDWAGARRLEQHDPAGAGALFQRGCEGGDGHACLRLYGYAREAPELTDEKRTRAFALACAQGLLEPCEWLASRGVGSPRAEDKQSALAAMADGCTVAQDQASCVRLAVAYDTGALGGVPVLARRDPVRAVSLYERACPPRFAAVVMGGDHADPKRADEARALVAQACERAAEHHLSGDGVPKDLLTGLQYLRRCATEACRATREELRRSSVLAAADDREDQEEIAAHERATAAGARTDDPTAGTLTASAPTPTPTNPPNEADDRERDDGDDATDDQRPPD